MPKAKYEGIYHSLKKRIEAQDYPYQSLLPSENTLFEEYAWSRNTVRRALAELTNDGYVQAMQGRGVRVIYQPVGKTTFTIGGIETFQETARRNRLRAVTKVLEFKTVIIVTDQDIAGIRLDEEITIIYVLIAVTVIVQFSKSIDNSLYQYSDV